MINYYTLRISGLTRVRNLNILPRAFHSHAVPSLSLSRLLATPYHTFSYARADCAHQFWPTWGHASTMTLWFDLSNNFSSMRELAFIKRAFFPFLRSCERSRCAQWSGSFSTESQKLDKLMRAGPSWLCSLIEPWTRDPTAFESATFLLVGVAFYVPLRDSLLGNLCSVRGKWADILRYFEEAFLGNE